MSLKNEACLIPINAARQCATCKNHIPHTLTCRAYPNGIPMEIIRGRVDHSKPYQGDKGILYTSEDPENPQTAPYIGKPMDY